MMIILILKSIILEPLLTILYFPIWWYGEGLSRRARWTVERIKYLAQFLSLKILLVNLFKPMFGEYSRSGRIISFFMRCFLLFTRFIIFGIGSLFFIGLFFVWLFLPILAVWQIYVLLE